MTVAPHLSMPILKLKRGEKRALGIAAPRIHATVMPLTEIVQRIPDRNPTVEAHLKTSYAGLAESASSYARCFIDAREMAPDGPAAAEEAFRLAAEVGISFTPVTGIDCLAPDWRRMRLTMGTSCWKLHFPVTAAAEPPGEHRRLRAVSGARAVYHKPQFGTMRYPPTT